MSNKLINKDYIISIDRTESMVQIKILNQNQILTYYFDNIEHAIIFTISISNGSGFLNFDEMSNDIKTNRTCVRTAETPLKTQPKTKAKTIKLTEKVVPKTRKKTTKK